jgi:hypothetical protein
MCRKLNRIAPALQYEELVIEHHGRHEELPESVTSRTLKLGGGNLRANVQLTPIYMTLQVPKLSKPLYLSNKIAPLLCTRFFWELAKTFVSTTDLTHWRLPRHHWE